MHFVHRVRDTIQTHVIRLKLNVNENETVKGFVQG
uniref:Uncharacterized protein n=1 Tax=Anguilla anguilla TaxID=7936 RepID=A0A0E9RTM0_ANGAN